MLNVFTLSVIMPSVDMLSLIMLSVIMLNGDIIRKDCFQNKSEFIIEEHFTEHMNIPTW